MEEFDKYAEDGKLYIFDSSHGINYDALPLGTMNINIPSSAGTPASSYELCIGATPSSLETSSSWTLPIPNLSVVPNTNLERIKVPAELGQKVEDSFINLFSSFSSESDTNLAKTLYNLIIDPTLKVG